RLREELDVPGSDRFVFAPGAVAADTGRPPAGAIRRVIGFELKPKIAELPRHADGARTVAIGIFYRPVRSHLLSVRGVRWCCDTRRAGGERRERREKEGRSQSGQEHFHLNVLGQLPNL